MKLQVIHRTLYQYHDAVTTSHHEARLSPRESENQRTLKHDLVITPEPEMRRRRFDYFGNRTIHFSIAEPHNELEVRATSVVEINPARPVDLSAAPAWESVRDRLRSDRRRDMLDAYAMCFESSLIARDNTVRAYAMESFDEGRPLLSAAYDLMGRIHRDFTYDPAATDVSTPLTTLLEKRRGVCQDFAHLAIGCLRCMGLPARYVSGYLLTRPPPGKTKLVGADASHAWFSTFVPEYGWVDFDPTNNLIPGSEHITLAYGRDFADVTPIRGVILGGGQHELSVAVDVDQVDEDRYRSSLPPPA